MRASIECIQHAEGSFEREIWNMSIRRSQEAVELELTAVLALLGIHYPKSHDQAPLLMRVLKMKGFDIGFDAEKIEEISIDLSRKRGPALHQEEGYNKDVAIDAIKDAKFVLNCMDELIKKFF
jgi:HEPN domain-containing protein